MLTAGLIDRAIDRWEVEYGSSTVKNTISALVLDKAVRDDLLASLPATTAMRISEVSGLTVGDVDLAGGIIRVQRQTYPGRGGLVTKATKGRRKRTIPIIDPLRPTLESLRA